MEEGGGTEGRMLVGMLCVRMMFVYDDVWVMEVVWRYPNQMVFSFKTLCKHTQTVLSTSASLVSIQLPTSYNTSNNATESCRQSKNTSTTFPTLSPNQETLS